ncbi:uncharacterized protein KZ484_007242 [Pholidichthys leucotaenia]
MASDMTLLWGSGSPPCWRVMIALEEKGLQGYNQKLLSFEKGEHKSPEVLQLNPRGQLPTFKHGDNIVNESYGACLYLEGQLKSQGTKLIPDSPQEQALMYQRMFEGLTFYEKLNAVVYYDWFVPEEERLESARKRNKEALTTELKLWEGYLPDKLDSNAYLAGPSFTMADVVIFPTVATLFRFGLSAVRYPKLGAYYTWLKERPSVKASWPPHWLENPNGQDTLKDILQLTQITLDNMAKNMTLLWGAGSPPCWRVMIALEEKNLQGYNQKLFSFDKMEHKSQEVLAVNPRGQLPAFKHGDIIVNESYAACFYLESQFGSQGTKLIPDSPPEQALMYQRMSEGLTFYDKLNGVIYYDWFVPEGERHDSALQRNKESLTTELKLWEGYLQKLGSGSHLAGPSFSLADVVIFPTVAYLFRFGLSAKRYPKLGEYYALLKERQSIKASWPTHWLENPEGQDTLKDI